MSGPSFSFFFLTLVPRANSQKNEARDQSVRSGNEASDQSVRSGYHVGCECRRSAPNVKSNVGWHIKSNVGWRVRGLNELRLPATCEPTLDLMWVGVCKSAGLDELQVSASFSLHTETDIRSNVGWRV
jgi:hypothetical protein